MNGITITTEGIAIVISIVSITAGLIAVMANTWKWYGSTDTRLKILESNMEKICDKTSVGEKTNVELLAIMNALSGRMVRMEDTIGELVKTVADLVGQLKTRRKEDV